MVLFDFDLDKMLYTIPPEKHGKEDLAAILAEHPEVRFVSIVGIDIGGHDTDEKIPVDLFLKDYDKLMAHGVQTDGSSVVLPKIADLNNAKVDIIPDPNVNWFVDHNLKHIDTKTGLPIGTLRIPAFLLHDDVAEVGARVVLKNSINTFTSGLMKLLEENPYVFEELPIDSADDIEELVLTGATELEFWVKTPLEDAAIEEMSASQVLQEQYWERTHGIVRTAMEQCLLVLDKYGFKVEMGHKEVGGLKAQIDESGRMTHVCEQLEIDWRFADALQAADNELFVRTIVREVFRGMGLEVNFKAKPMIGLAGNGEHTHIGMAAITKDGKLHNLFTADDQKKDFMSAIGYGSLMGLLKNYEVINPFVSATNDSLNRLKPGFEAPVCVVTSLGHTPEIPSRNRTILTGLIRDLSNPYATRFELRACNPYTNTYLVLAAIYSACLDGVKACATHTTAECLAEISKDAGEEGFYLEKDRAYRSEDDVFEDYTEEERTRLFGAPPATVWENMQNFENYPAKLAVITAGGALRDQIIEAFRAGALTRWKTELIARIIPENRDIVRAAKEAKTDFVTDLDSYNWNKINGIRSYLAKDSIDEKSLFTLLINALNDGDYATASGLQVEMYDKVEELKSLYDSYVKNMI